MSVSLALVESEAPCRGRMMYPAGNRRSMTADGFARLLEGLHPDAGQAALEYERLRRALVKFFDWRGVAAAEECADDVFDRLAQRLENTMVQDVTKYAHGIARLVALERRRGPAHSSLDELPYMPVAAAPVE